MISFAFTKLSWEPGLNRKSLIEIPILPFVVSILGKQETLQVIFICFREFSTVRGECKYNSVYFTLWHFQVASGTLQTFSNSQWCNPGRIDRSSRCFARVQWLLPVLYNMKRRFKHLNVVFWERKSSSMSCTYNTSQVWVCWLLGGELAHETITWKKSSGGHALYRPNGHGTRPRDRRSTLVDKQINKSDDAIMWLYTSCNPYPQK